MTIDFNNAGQPRSRELIPDSTVIPVQLTLRAGGEEEGGWLKRSRNGTARMLDLEFTVIDGPYARRKFWTMLTVQGETAGQLMAVEISSEHVRKMLESAHGIKPSDKSEAAAAARQISSWEELDSLRVWVV